MLINDDALVRMMMVNIIARASRDVYTGPTHVNCQQSLFARGSYIILVITKIHIDKDYDGKDVCLLRCERTAS